MKPAAFRGFTLMELMIAVAIVGILGAIAFPSYRSYVQRTHRAVAKTALSEIASRQEAYFADRKRYAGTLSQLSYGGDTLYVQRDGSLKTSESGDSLYALSLAAHSTSACPASGSATANGYTLNAAPVGAQAGDSRCGTLCMTSTGIKKASGTATDCWMR